MNYYNLTIALDQTGTLREERVALHDTLQRDASYTPTHNQMGLLNMKEVQQAAGRKRIGEGDFFGRALCRSKNNLGVLMRNKGDGVRAEALFRQTITERPGYAQAMTNLGSLLASEGQMAEADDLFSKVIESNLANVAALSEGNAPNGDGSKAGGDCRLPNSGECISSECDDARGPRNSSSGYSGP
ncbi:MAG: tetratricopeptide repeat protein [Edaphobacter sp.]